MLIVIRAGYKKIVLNGKTHPWIPFLTLNYSQNPLVPYTFCFLAVVLEMLFSNELGF
jgi:hypothetical protein